MTLTRLQRLGIVASVVWAIGAGLYQRYQDTHVAQQYIEMSVQQCAGDRKCVAQVELWGAGITQETFAPVSNAIVAALVPIPFFWLIAWALVRVTRWVLKGKSSPS